jgi:hypothetical protein
MDAEVSMWKGARRRFSDEEEIVLDELCDEIIAWSKIYYEVTFVTYVILMELARSAV